MLPCIDGKIREQMWSVARTLVLLLLLIGCKKEEIGPGSCAQGATQLEGICRSTCNDDSECLVSEFCDRGPRVCLPEPMADRAKVKVFAVNPVPVPRGQRVTIDFGVVSADRLRIDVAWDDGAVETLHDTTIEFFGTKLLEDVTRNGTVQLVATRNGVDEPRNGDILLDDGTPRIDEFKVDPARVNVGDSVTVYWKVSNQNAPIEISIEGGSVLTDDALSEDSLVLPIFAKTTFVLSSGDLFARATADVNQVGVAPEILGFEVRGAQPALSDYPLGVVWHTRNAVGVRLYIDDQERFMTQYPPDVDRGAVPLILPPGYHDIRLEAFGNEQVVASQNITVHFLSDQPPQIAQFEHPVLAFDGEDIRVQWAVTPPDPDVTSVSFGWLDAVFSDVGFEASESRTSPGYTVTALLRAESPVGVAEARGTTFAIVAESEPNDDNNSAQAMNGFAIQGVTDALDVDVFSAGMVGTVQTLEVALHGPCPLGLVLSVDEESGQSTTAIATFDGDCPRISYTPPQNQIRTTIAVRHSLDVPGVPYVLAAEILDPICGDGKAGGFEPCDDGNRINGDGCSADCQSEELVDYQLVDMGTGGIDLRPADARVIDFRAYPDGGGLPAQHGFGTIELPGGFSFFERNYHVLVIHADGFVSFLPDFFLPFDPQRPMETSAPNELISLFGADLRPGIDSGVYAWNTNSGGLAIEWENFVLIGSVGSRLTGRIVLEPDGGISLAYLAVENADPSASFTAGLQDRRGGRTLILPQEDLNGSVFEIQRR